MSNKDKIYIKICGMRRTGTNLTARFLYDNFNHDEFVLLSRSKHVPLYNYEKWLNDVPNWNYKNDLISEDIHYHLGSRWKGREGLSRFNLGLDNKGSNYCKNEYIVEKKEIQNAYKEGRLKIIICLKDPLALIYSQIKWAGYNLATYPLSDVINGINYFYLDAIKSLNSIPENKFFLPCELYHHDHNDVGKVISNFLQLKVKNNIKKIDYQISPPEKKIKKYDYSFYKNKEYLGEFKLNQLVPIYKSLFWEIFEKLGYEKTVLTIG